MNCCEIGNIVLFVVFKFRLIIKINIVNCQPWCKVNPFKKTFPPIHYKSKDGFQWNTLYHFDHFRNFKNLIGFDP
jgi:hypothetical protein